MALATFTRQFATMVGSGLPLMRALVFLANSTNSGDLQLVLRELCRSVESGKRLSHSLRDFPEVFSEVYMSLVDTGESSGLIHTVLLKLADLLERQVNLRSKIISAATGTSRSLQAARP